MAALALFLSTLTPSFSPGGLKAVCNFGNFRLPQKLWLCLLHLLWTWLCHFFFHTLPHSLFLSLVNKVLVAFHNHCSFFSHSVHCFQIGFGTCVEAPRPVFLFGDLCFPFPNPNVSPLFFALSPDARLLGVLEFLLPLHQPSWMGCCNFHLFLWSGIVFVSEFAPFGSPQGHACAVLLRVGSLKPALPFDRPLRAFGFSTTDYIIAFRKLALTWVLPVRTGIFFFPSLLHAYPISCFFYLFHSFPVYQKSRSHSCVSLVRVPTVLVLFFRPTKREIRVAELRPGLCGHFPPTLCMLVIPETTLGALHQLAGFPFILSFGLHFLVHPITNHGGFALARSEGGARACGGYP